MEEKYYTTKQAAEKTRFSIAVIKSAIKKGELEAVQIPDHTKYGFHYMVEESKLMQFAATKKVYASEPKTVQELAVLLQRMLKDEYERGLRDGKNEARRAFTEAVKGMK